jgi:hypothetical protein
MNWRSQPETGVALQRSAPLPWSQGATGVVAGYRVVGRWGPSVTREVHAASVLDPVGPGSDDTPHAARGLSVHPSQGSALGRVLSRDQSA